MSPEAVPATVGFVTRLSPGSAVKASRAKCRSRSFIKKKNSKNPCTKNRVGLSSGTALRAEAQRRPGGGCYQKTVGKIKPRNVYRPAQWASQASTTAVFKSVVGWYTARKASQVRRV